ncbi:MAG: hypothetical protein KF821_01930 [Anaerolineales bacterium]|nr:hypothetical protein [Anaerolineales bacterium]
MKLSVIFPYTKAYGDFATPYTESIHKHEPAVQVVGVNTEGEPDYRYTQALNQGARQAAGDWLMFTNDDILCQGEFVELVSGLDPNNIYGMELRHKTKEEWGADVEYLYGWILLMHRQLYDGVGPFEEQYLHAGFDDIDYCWRAKQAGFGLEVIDLPFVHLADQPGGEHRRYTVPGYREQMARSKRFFLAKVNLAARGYTKDQSSALLMAIVPYIDNHVLFEQSLYDQVQGAKPLELSSQ